MPSPISGDVSMENESANPEPIPGEPAKAEPMPDQDAAAPEEALGDPPPAEPSVKAKGPKSEGEPAAPAPSAEPADSKHWYIVKVQSGREESIKNAIERRVKIEGLQDCYGQIVIPTEKFTDMVRGKRVVKERKLFPGYLMVNVEYNDRILYLFRETSGVGDFVGASLNKAPQPMPAGEVDSMLRRLGDKSSVSDVVAKPKFDKGDRVKVKDGTFAGMEGEVKELLEAKGAVRVELRIFDRPVPVELEYWQVDNV
jgi:transcription termination/antitermination protein NusG